LIEIRKVTKVATNKEREKITNTQTFNEMEFDLFLFSFSFSSRLERESIGKVLLGGSVWLSDHTERERQK